MVCWTHESDNARAPKKTQSPVIKSVCTYYTVITAQEERRLYLKMYLFTFNTHHFPRYNKF